MVTISLSNLHEAFSKKLLSSSDDAFDLCRFTRFLFLKLSSMMVYGILVFIKLAVNFHQDYKSRIKNEINIINQFRMLTIKDDLFNFLIVENNHANLNDRLKMFYFPVHTMVTLPTRKLVSFSIRLIIIPDYFVKLN